MNLCMVQIYRFRVLVNLSPQKAKTDNNIEEAELCIINGYPEGKKAASVNVHVPCHSVTMKAATDRWRSVGPRTPHII